MNYSGILRTLCNSDILRTLAYSEFWHNQNQKHIQVVEYGPTWRTFQFQAQKTK